ncbi:MAG: saccharopine dehydrogenase NADP-binding domain-containing protein [Actinobacteria bacterium]|nr:saccharopine dehydrogenase NADP-binding domain-containing protein [Actinomycetota bacterium]
MSATDSQAPPAGTPPAAPGGSLSVAVLGAGGTIAPAIVRDLAESAEVSGQLLLDVNAEQAERTAAAHGGGKATAAAVDARDSKALADLLDGRDVIVNSASYPLNLGVMEACLLAGCHYIDLGGLYWTTLKQLELNDRFRDAGLLALFGMGSAPGKTNVMGAQVTAALDGEVERMMITAGGRDLDPPEGFAPPYAVRTLLDELTLSPVVLRDGKPVEIEALSSGGIVEFPLPIGDAPSIYTLHSELVTFGESFGCAEAGFRLSLGPTVLKRLKSLIGASDAEVEAVIAGAVKPSSRTVSVHIVDAWRGDRHARATCTTSPHEAWGLGGSVVSTATPAAAAVRLLARGVITARGALPPESCVGPEDLYPELESRGARFELEVGAE